MLRIVQMGLGPIGLATAARAIREKGMELVGVVDADPALVGSDLGQLVGREPMGLAVAADVIPVLEATRPDLVLHATGSFLEEVQAQLLPIVGRGTSIVSTCEELAYPFYRHPELSQELDRAARDSGAVLLGSGVNPGFVMDKFVVTLMAACESVDSVRVHRVVDAATRGEVRFKRRSAPVCPASEFEEKCAGGRMGHIGLAESAHMLADAMGAGRERVLTRELGPVLATVRSPPTTRVCRRVRWPGFTRRSCSRPTKPSAFEWSWTCSSGRRAHATPSSSKARRGWRSRSLRVLRVMRERWPSCSAARRWWPGSNRGCARCSRSRWLLRQRHVG